MFSKENGNQLISMSVENRTRKSWLHLRWKRLKRLMRGISKLLFKYERKKNQRKPVLVSKWKAQYWRI